MEKEKKVKLVSTTKTVIKKNSPKAKKAKPKTTIPIKSKKTTKDTQVDKANQKIKKEETNAKKKVVKEVVRPVPKPKNFTKEEKNLYRKLEEAFTFVANMTNVIEERLMDKKLIPDLTLSELHVIEVVNKNNQKPMSLIANELNITVGALITSINRLIQKDYLLRTRDEMDRRVILLSVTPKAKKVLKVHDKFHDDILGLTLEGVTIRDATKVLVQISNVLKNYYHPKEIKKR